MNVARLAVPIGGIGLALFLPWLQVAGRSRSGLSSAQLLVSLAEVGAPEGLRVLGLLWYLGGFAAVIGWGALAAPSVPGAKVGARMGAVVAVLAWAGFALWAASDDRVLVRWPAPS